MFEKASRLKVRFNYKGLCSVEDLWDMSLTTLDSIFKTLNAQNKTQKEESLLEVRSQEDTVLDLKIALVKHVFTVRSLEQKARADAAANAAEKQKLMGILAKKQDTELEGLSMEDLNKRIAALSA
jgi:hypothetical protein